MRAPARFVSLPSVAVALILSGIVGAEPAIRTISISHINYSGPSVEAHERFWIDILGGKIGKVVAPELKGMLLISVPGFMVDSGAGSGKGGTRGSTFDHTAFRVKDLGALLGKLKAAGYRDIATAEQRSQEIAHATRAAGSPPALAFINAPDDILVVFIEDKSLNVPLYVDHMHLMASPGRLQEMGDWYANLLGVKVARSGPDFRSFDLPEAPGALVISQSKTPVASIRGRVVDHFGFQIKDLEPFYKRHEARGMKFSRPYGKFPPDIYLAFVTDPQDSDIELTQYSRKKVFYEMPGTRSKP